MEKAKRCYIDDYGCITAQGQMDSINVTRCLDKQDEIIDWINDFEKQLKYTDFSLQVHTNKVLEYNIKEPIKKKCENCKHVFYKAPIDYPGCALLRDKNSCIINYKYKYFESK